MGISAVIVEDEPLARQTLRDFVGETPWLDLIGEAEDGLTAVRLIDEVKPDLVFLDVEMPELSGLEALKRIQHKPAIIFTTAYDTYAVPAFELEALDYLLKPFGRERFHRTLERVKRRLLDSQVETQAQFVRERMAQASDASEPLERVFVRERDYLLPLQVNDIIRLEANDDYTVIHVAGKRFLVSITLHDFEKRLNPVRFRRVHRSTIVNLDQVRSMEQQDRRFLLRMSDGSEVLTSRAGSKGLKDLIA